MLIAKNFQELPEVEQDDIKNHVLTETQELQSQLKYLATYCIQYSKIPFVNLLDDLFRQNCQGNDIRNYIQLTNFFLSHIKSLSPKEKLSTIQMELNDIIDQNSGSPISVTISEDTPPNPAIGIDCEKISTPGRKNGLSIPKVYGKSGIVFFPSPPGEQENIDGNTINQTNSSIDAII